MRHDDANITRQRAMFAGLEKSPCLLGNQLIQDGATVDDAVIQTACLHSIAISLRRIADKLLDDPET